MSGILTVKSVHFSRDYGKVLPRFGDDLDTECCIVGRSLTEYDALWDLKCHRHMIFFFFFFFFRYFGI